MRLEFKHIVGLLITWVVIISSGYFLNNIFLKQNSFARWDWEFLIFPAILFVFSILSEKYYRAITYLYLTMMLILCILSVICNHDGFGGDSFNQFGLESIEYGSNLIFLHNESLLQGSISVLTKLLPIKWALFISCTLVIVSTTCLLLFLNKLNFKNR